MSSKHRTCCCEGSPLQPCCGFLACNVNWAFSEGYRVHFTGHNSVAEATSWQRDVNGVAAYGDTSTHLWTAQSMPAVMLEGTDLAQLYSTLTASASSIILVDDALRYPKDVTTQTRVPLLRYIYENAVSYPPTEYVPPAFTTRPYTRPTPYCGYFSKQNAVIETQEFVPGYATSYDSAGFWTFRTRQVFPPSAPPFWRMWAEKISAFKVSWFVEPFIYPNSTEPVRFAAGIVLRPTGGTALANTIASNYEWYGPTPVFSPVIGPLPSVVISLISPNTGFGCPFNLTWSSEPSPNVSRYRGTASVMAPRGDTLEAIANAFEVTTYPAQYTASGYRRYAAVSSSNVRVDEAGALTSRGGDIPKTATLFPSIPLEFSGGASNLTVSVTT